MPALPLTDFHCHSVFSDGVLTPLELLDLAQQRGVRQLAITDHDSVRAYSPMLTKQAQQRQIALVTGCEFSCVWQRRNIHVLGLNMDLSHPSLMQAMASQATARQSRAAKITRVLQRLGFVLTLPEIQKLAGVGSIGRPHFAEYLVTSGQMPSAAVAFKRALGSGKPGDVKAEWPSLETVLGWITNAGGVAVVAHPLKYKMTLTKLRSLLDDFRQAGGQGIEVLTGFQEPARVSALVDLALRYELYGSAGSDFHRPGQPWAELGRLAALPERCTPIWQLWT